MADQAPIDPLAEPPSEDVAVAKKRGPWLRRLIAWGVTLAVIAFLLTRYSPSAIGAAVVRGNWAAMIPIVFAASLWAVVFMSTADWLLFTAALGPLRWLDVLRGKAGSSVLQAINHTVGQGAYAVWLARRTNNDAITTVGVIAYVIATDLVALFAIVTAAVWLVEPESLPNALTLRWLSPLLVVGLLVFVFAGPRVLPRIVKRARLLAPWKKISPQVFVAIVAFRIVAVSGVMTATWGAARVFGLPLPLSACLAYLPIIFLAAALPINVLGFGAVQLVWVAAFEEWASGPEILAFQFLSQALAVSAFVLRGMPFLPSVLRDIAPQKR